MNRSEKCLCVCRCWCLIAKLDRLETHGLEHGPSIESRKHISISSSLRSVFCQIYRRRRCGPVACNMKSIINTKLKDIERIRQFFPFIRIIRNLKFSLEFQAMEYVTWKMSWRIISTWFLVQSSPMSEDIQYWVHYPLHTLVVVCFHCHAASVNNRMIQKIIQLPDCLE